LLTLQTDLVTNVWVAPKGDAPHATQVTQGPGKYDGYYGLTWTPDGKIVYASIASGAWDIWQMNADGTNAKQLTSDARSNYGPSVSSDGRYIVFVSNRGGGAFHVWRMNTDGSEQKQLTFNEEENFAHTTANGRWVIYASVDFAQANYIWKVPIDGGPPVRLTDKNSSWPFPSPDGKQFVCTYQLDANAPPKLAVFSIDGGAPLKLFDVPQTFRQHRLVARWARDSFPRQSRGPRQHLGATARRRRASSSDRLQNRRRPRLRLVARWHARLRARHRDNRRRDHQRFQMMQLLRASIDLGQRGARHEVRRANVCGFCSSKMSRAWRV